MLIIVLVCISVYAAMSCEFEFFCISRSNKPTSGMPNESVTRNIHRVATKNRLALPKKSKSNRPEDPVTKCFVISPKETSQHWSKVELVSDHCKSSSQIPEENCLIRSDFCETISSCTGEDVR